MRDDADPQADFDAQKAFTPWTSAWNVTGMPAVSLPLHWTPDGLPVGVMLAARPAEEELLLAPRRPGRDGRALGRPAAAGMVTVRHTAQLSADELAAARALCDASFDDFGDADWEHALGGMHVLVLEDDGGLVAHGALVMRRVLHRGRALRCGYVEAVAVHGRPPAPRPRASGDGGAGGPGAGVRPARAVLVARGAALYEARGWSLWRGSDVGRSRPDGLAADAGRGLDLRARRPAGLDLDGPIACDWRDGDVW